MKNNYSSNDFTENGLPKTRREQFTYHLKSSFPTLNKIGIILLFFSIPLLVAIYLESAFSYNLFNNAQYFINNDLNENGMKLYVNNMMLFSVIKSICYLILFIPLSGIFRILRLMYYSEPYNFKIDFKKGMKQNIKTFLLLGMIFAISRVCLTLATILNIPLILKILIYLIILLVLLPIVIVGCIYTSLYKGNIFTVIKHSFLIYVKKFAYILALLLSLILISTLYLIPLFIIKIVSIILVIVFILPIYLLMWYGMGIYVMDRTINHYYYKDSENRGLANE